MAKKQFRMEKRLGTSVCADISKYALKNQYVRFLYKKITQQIFFGWKLLFFCRFLDQIGLQKLFFGLTWSETLFFSIQYWKKLQFTKTFFDNIYVFRIKNKYMVTKAFFMNAIKK